MIGIIGALSEEVEGILSNLNDKKGRTVGGLNFYSGKISGKDVAVVKCGVGKALAAAATEAMIITYNPDIIINTGVSGALSPELNVLDVVLSTAVCQHDMDTTPIGEPKGYLDAIKTVFIGADEKALNVLKNSAQKCNLAVKTGVIASGDQFISSKEQKTKIIKEFNAISCEMEGGAIGHIAAMNKVPFVVLRAISDKADGEASMSFPEFCYAAAENTLKVLLSFIEQY